MRTAVVFFPTGRRNAVREIAKGVGRGIESQGHQVDLIDASRDKSVKFTMYQYLAVGTEPQSLISGRVSDEIGLYLSQAGLVGGKRCFAFVSRYGLNSQKTLLNLMKKMESEGMFIRFSEVISTPEEAEALGERLQIDKDPGL